MSYREFCLLYYNLMVYYQYVPAPLDLNPTTDLDKLVKYRTIFVNDVAAEVGTQVVVPCL
jgi:hypothetical protein